jgi:predicted O-linked N-acetylglucosamine transferase (SPINDLY family)
MTGILQEQSQAALAALERDLAADPASAARHVALANALAGLRRPAEAIAHYERAVALAPDSADWRSNLASLLTETGRHAEAVAEAARALVIDPRNFGALYNQAVGLLKLGRSADAAARLRECARLQPADARVYNNLGLALAADRQLGAAIAAYDRALALRPDYARAWNNRGLAEIHRYNYARALADLDAALAIDSRYVAAIVNRGIALSGLGKKTAALECYRRAFPAAQALANASALLRDMNRGAEAYECAQLLYRVAPELDEVAGVHHAMSQNVAAWSDYESRVDAIVAAVRSGRRAAHPFAFLSVADSPLDQLECSRAFARTLGGEAPLWNGGIYRHDRIRVAYLSADFHDHATTYLAIGLFEHHDRERFEVHALAYGKRTMSDAMRSRLRAAFEHFEDVDGLSARQTAERVRDLEIDLLIDLKGYTADSRIDILAHRPAPIQAHYLGYPGTLGAPFVDYLIADREVIPPERRAAYSEQLVYLPHCYQATDDRRTFDPAGWSRERAGLPTSGPVLCAFHQIYKLNPPLFDVWMRLLQRLPQATLWLLADDAAAKARLREEAHARGVDPARLVFAPRMEQGLHLARQRVADLFLDAWPVGAHTSASDALWAGLPVVALRGSGFAARVSASIVRAAGLDDLVTDSLAQYEELIYRLCTEGDRLARLRQHVAQTVRNSALFDTAAFTRALEAAYLQMWTLYQAGRPPQPIEVASSRPAAKYAAPCRDSGAAGLQSGVHQWGLS